MMPMTFNPVITLMQAARNGGSPMRTLEAMARNNPQAAQALQLVSGRNSEQLKQLATNMCRERGTTPEALARQLGLK